MGLRREISGNDLLLFIDPSGGTNYYLVVCLTSQSKESTTNEIDAASKCGPKVLPGNQTNKISFEFHDVLDTSNGEISSGALFTLQQNKTTVGWKFGKAIPAAGDETYTGTGFIATHNVSAAQNDVVKTSSSIGIYTIALTTTGS